MTFLTPLGLLGLLGIAILILIYIIKPNYQQKFVSSTFVWKLSLKYRKKRLPTSKLRNILLIICQVLALVSLAVILAQPAEVLKVQKEEAEVIVIVDSSSSMQTEFNGETRFERAIEQATEFCDTVLAENGLVSVIIADAAPSYLVQRVDTSTKYLLDEAIEDLLLEEYPCSYGVADIDSSIVLCEDIIEDNPSATIHYYTDTNYEYVPDGITVNNVAYEEEWNGAILNAYAELEDNFYTFYVDVATYGIDTYVEVNVEIQNANAANSTEEGSTYTFTHEVFCTGEETTTIVFINADFYENLPGETNNTEYYIIENSDRIYAYQSIHVSIDSDDNYAEDNTFNIYGGQKEVITIQYSSSAVNKFFPTSLGSIKKALQNHWDIQITEVKQGTEPALEGFDFYIFEHTMPEELPTDGVVILSDIDKIPRGADFTISSSAANIDLRGESVALTEEKEHPILNNVFADDITISRYNNLTSYDGYEVLMNCIDAPVLLIKDEPTQKVVIFGFSLNYSNLPITKDFPLLMYNIFNYFNPSTVDGNAFEVNEKVAVKSRGSELNVQLNGVDVADFTEFPSTLSVDLPGTYTLYQTTFSGKYITEYIYVKVPAAESNIHATAENIISPFVEQELTDYYNDLVVFIAAALVALLFAEWWLQSRENM